MSDDVTVLYFAKLAEEVGTRGESIPYTAKISTVEKLIGYLKLRDERWLKAFDGKTVLSAVNQDMSLPTQRIEAGDEVALFPPVTGG